MNQAKIASVKEQMDDLASQMEDMQAGVGKTQSAESAHRAVNHQELSQSPEILI